MANKVNILKAWRMRNQLCPNDKRAIAIKLKDMGYTDHDVSKYASTKRDMEKWKLQCDLRASILKDDDACEILKSISKEASDEHAIEGLTSFDRLTGLDAYWDGQLEDPVRARYK